MSNPTALVQKLWNYCNILRDDGLSYGDYVEQLTFLLFLKMADEQAKPHLSLWHRWVLARCARLHRQEPHPRQDAETEIEERHVLWDRARR